MRKLFNDKINKNGHIKSDFEKFQLRLESRSTPVIEVIDSVSYDVNDYSNLIHCKLSDSMSGIIESLENRYEAEKLNRTARKLINVTEKVVGKNLEKIIQTIRISDLEFIDSYMKDSMQCLVDKCQEAFGNNIETKILFDKCIFRNCLFSDVKHRIQFNQCTITGKANGNTDHGYNLFLNIPGGIRFYQTTVESTIISKNISWLSIVNSKLIGLNMIDVTNDFLKIEKCKISRTCIDEFYSEIVEMKENTYSNCFLMIDLDNQYSEASLQSIIGTYEAISVDYKNNSNRYMSRIYYLLSKFTIECYAKKEYSIYDLGWYEKLMNYFMYPRIVLHRIIIVIILFAFAYLGCGIAKNGHNYVEFSLYNFVNNPRVDGIEFIMNFIDSFYFSLISFATVGYGDYTTIGLGRVFSMLESIFSMFLIGTLASSIVKRYS